MRANKYRIYPTSEQRELLQKHFGHVRHVYNWALAEKDKHYKETGKSLNRADLQRMLVASKKTDKPWLSEVNSQSLLASLLNLDTAFTNFFKGRAKFPKTKKKYSGWQSFQCPQHVSIDFEKGLINLPKIKGIKAKIHRAGFGKIKTVTIKKTPSGKFFASVLFDDQSVLPTPSTIEPDKTIGLDVGLTHLLIDSSGNKINNPRFLIKSALRLKIEQRKLSRCKPKSANRRKQRLKVARLHEKVASQRSDNIHKITANLVFKNHATSFAVEDLNIKGMIKNKRLSKAIADASWSKFITTLGYKCQWYGKNLLKIGRFQPSSKTCFHCGFKMEKMPLSVRQWDCPSCGTKSICRDTNAARMIAKFAIADSLGHSDCVKCSHISMLVSASDISKGDSLCRHESQEAPTIADLSA